MAFTHLGSTVLQNVDATTIALPAAPQVGDLYVLNMNAATLGGVATTADPRVVDTITTVTNQQGIWIAVEDGSFAAFSVDLQNGSFNRCGAILSMYRGAAFTGLESVTGPNSSNPGPVAQIASRKAICAAWYNAGVVDGNMSTPTFYTLSGGNTSNGKALARTSHWQDINATISPAGEITFTGTMGSWTAATIGVVSDPDPPTDLVVSDETPSSLVLSWVLGVDAMGTRVRIDGGAPVDVGALLTHQFTGLDSSTTYLLEAQSYNVFGDSAWVSINGTTLGPYPTPLLVPPADPLCVPVGNLGRGSNVAEIQTRGGSRSLGEVPASQLSWGRLLDDMSEANLTIPVSSLSDECCAVLADTHTWGHEIVVYRDGERVWEGPIVNITEGSDGVTIRALDPLGYMLRRVQRGRTNASPVFAIDEAVDDVTEAFTLGGWDGADPNVLTYLEVLGAGTGPQTQRDVDAWSAYYFDTLDQLGDAGVNFTTVGRRIILWPDTLTLGRVPTLLPSQHLSNDVTITEDGLALSELAIVTTDNAIAGASSAPTFPTNDPFYGSVETLTNIPNLTSSAACTAAADSIRAQGYPAPVRVVIPDGSTLTADAPYAIGDLVPGVLMPVSHRGRCRSVDSDFVLTTLLVTQTPEGETVQITVSPVSSTVEA